MKNPFQRNKNPAGRIYNMQFGLLEVVDGLTRFLSAGFLHSDLLVTSARKYSRRQLEKLKAQQKNSNT
jgi:hypothetical protein